MITVSYSMPILSLTPIRICHRYDLNHLHLRLLHHHLLQPILPLKVIIINQSDTLTEKSHHGWNISNNNNNVIDHPVAKRRKRKSNFYPTTNQQRHLVLLQHLSSLPKEPNPYQHHHLQLVLLQSENRLHYQPPLYPLLQQPMIHGLIRVDYVHARAHHHHLLLNIDPPHTTRRVINHVPSKQVIARITHQELNSHWIYCGMK